MDFFDLFRKRPIPPAVHEGPILFSSEGTDYVVVRKLGLGPHGEQGYLAQPRTREGVGEWVLVMALRCRADWKARRRLAEEARLGSLFSHPGLGRVYGLHHLLGTDYLVSEYVAGYAVETLITFGLLRDRPLSEAFALYVATEVAAALHYTHTLVDATGHPLGITHRSVNPTSIRVGHQGEVKLVDFSTAWSLLPDRVTTSTSLLRGEVEYAAPERLCAQGKAVGDARSDLFSLGMVLLEMLTREHLYDLEELDVAATQAGPSRDKPSRLRSEVPLWTSVEDLAWRAASFRPEHLERATRGLSEPVRAILHKLLRREPTERYATGVELQADLRAALAALGKKSYGRREAALEVAVAKAEAEVSDERRRADVHEPGVFPAGRRVRQGDSSASSRT